MSETENRNELMSSIHLLSMQMLDCAKSQNWDEVCELEHQRADLLNNFSESDQITSTKDLIKQLQETIQVNEEIQVLSKQEMNHCLQKCVSMKRGKKAFAAYANNK